MNWLGWSHAATVAAIIGCTLGFLAYGYLWQAMGIEAPWAVGALVGLMGALASSQRNTLRGLVLGTFAVWTAAAAQAFYTQLTPGHRVIDGLVGFHATLTLGRFTQFAACALLAIGLGAMNVGLRRHTVEP